MSGNRRGDPAVAGTPPRRHRTLTSLSATCLALALALAGLMPAAAGATTGTSNTAAIPARGKLVVVLLTPYLTWDDLSPAATPQLWSLARDGGIANMNAVTAESFNPTAADGALTISAGRWAAVPPDLPALPSSFAAAREFNANSLNAAQPGALGSAIHAAGGLTAAVGCGDEDTSTPTGHRSPAALLAADARGSIDIEATGADLLTADGSAPFGVRADPEKMRSAIAGALARLGAGEPGHAALLVVDSGDLERAHNAAAAARQPDAAAAAAAARLHAVAVAATDSLAGELLDELEDMDALLLVIAPATEKPYYEPPRFGPVIARGENLRGVLTSQSTHRDGLVTNLDIAPTILSAMELETPLTMLGAPISKIAGAPTSARPAGSETLGARIEALTLSGISAGAIDFLRDRRFVRLATESASVLALLCAIVALLPVRVRDRRFVRTVMRGAVLLALSVPSAAWLMFALRRHPTAPAQAFGAFALATAAVFAVALTLSLHRRLPAEAPVLFLSALTTLVICADQWFGGPIESGLFSYSVRAGWRYFGMGNEGAALTVAASIAMVGLSCDLAEKTGRHHARALRLWAMPVVGCVVLLTAAAPFAGANAGVAIWGIAAYAAAWLHINRVKITWAKAALVVVGAVLLVAAFVAVDLLPGTSETHLGKFVSDTATGGLPVIRDLVYRKMVNAIGYIPHTPYTWLALSMTASIALTRLAVARPLERLAAVRPAYAGALAGVLVGGAAALLTEDSSIVMPALMFFAGAMPAFYLMLKEPEAS